MPARSIACRDARVANCEVYSPGAALRRCLIPVRVVIHSSEVSTIFSRSALVRTPSGYERPVPRMPARIFDIDNVTNSLHSKPFRGKAPRTWRPLNGSRIRSEEHTSELQSHSFI